MIATILLTISGIIYIITIIDNEKLKEKAKMQQNTINYYNDILIKTLTDNKGYFQDTKEITEYYNTICRKFNKKHKQKQSKRKYQHKQRKAMK